MQWGSNKRRRYCELACFAPSARESARANCHLNGHRFKKKQSTYCGFEACFEPSACERERESTRTSNCLLNGRRFESCRCETGCGIRSETGKKTDLYQRVVHVVDGMPARHMFQNITWLSNSQHCTLFARTNTPYNRPCLSNRSVDGRRADKVRRQRTPERACLTGV